MNQDAQTERRLTGARSGADDGHAARLETLENEVQGPVAGLEAVELSACLTTLFEDVGLGEQQTLQWRHRVNSPVVADLIDLAFGLIDETDHVVGRDVRVVNDLAAHRDEAALLGLVAHDLGVVLRVRRGRRVHLQ